MKGGRALRVLRPSLALVALTVALVLLGLLITGPAGAATKSPTPRSSRTAKLATTEASPSTAARSTQGAAAQRGAEIRAGEDVVVAKGSTVPSVVAFGGDVTVNGRVTDAVVAFGGDVVVNGSVGSSVVAFGGDVTINGSVARTTVAFGGDIRLGETAVVGNAVGPKDASLVALGGDVIRAPGAQVHGLIKRSAGSVRWRDVIGWGAHGLFFSPLLRLSFAGWLVQTAFFLVLALVAAALMPGALHRVQRQVRSRPWASLGWGALAFWIGVPVAFLALGITIIGLLLWLPLAVFVLLVYFFGSTALVALLAQRILTGFGGKESLMLSVALGVVGATTLSRIPVVGVVLVFVMVWIGTGGVVLAVAQRRRERREAAAVQAAAIAAAAAEVPGGAQYPRSAEVATPASVITPIVQTSPEQQAAAQAAAAREVAARQAAAEATRQAATRAAQAPPQPPGVPPVPAMPEPPVTPEAPATPEPPAGARPLEGAGPKNDDAPPPTGEGEPPAAPGS